MRGLQHLEAALTHTLDDIFIAGVIRIAQEAVPDVEGHQCTVLQQVERVDEGIHRDIAKTQSRHCNQKVEIGI